VRLIVSLEVYDAAERERIGSPYELKWATEGATEAQLEAASALLGVVVRKLSTLAALAEEGHPEAHLDPSAKEVPDGHYHKESQDGDPQVRSRSNPPRYRNRSTGSPYSQPAPSSPRRGVGR